MATIKSSIELYDAFTAPMMDIIQAVNMGLSAMENLQQGMNQSVDTTSIDGARDALNQATEAAQALEAAMQGMDIPEQTNPVQVPVQPEIPDPIVPPSDPVTVPVQWQSENFESFLSSGTERFQQEIQSANSMMDSLNQKQAQIAATAASASVLPSNAVTDINNVGSRLQAVQQRIQQIESNPLNIGTDTANAALEQMRGQLAQALEAQNDLNTALDNMDVSAANQAYMRLSQSVRTTETYIRDNVSAQGTFNNAVTEGIGIADSLQRTISGVIAAYTGIAGIQKAIGFIKNTTSLYDTQLNGEVQLLSVLANSLDEETIAKYAVDVDVSADTTDAVNQINGIQDSVTGVEVPVSAKTDALMDAYNQIADKATEIQGKGIYGDEAMIAAGAEFATYFTDTDAITKMMDTLSDYAIGMSGGGALDSTALVDYATGLGKIMTGAYDAMNEKGFEFSDTQKAIINGTATQAQIVQTLGAEYADASSDMQAAATISQVIEESWAGLYENMSQTPEGKIIQLTNAWGDLEEELGGILYPAVLDFLNLFTENWDEVGEFCTMFANGLAILVELATQLVNGALLVASAFQDNWGWIAPIVWGIVAAFTAYNVVLGIYNGIQAVSNGLKAASAMADQVHAAALMMESGATFTATAAQYGFNAALLACPVTWIVAAVLALIVILYALVGIINQVARTSISATGLITGAVAVAGAFILNIGIGLYNSFIAVIAAFVNFFIGIIEWVLNAANGGFNSFGDAVANLIGQIISWFLSLGQIVTTIIDAIFGTDWTAGLEGLKNSVTQWGKNENAITLDRMDTSTAGLQRFDYGDAASAGYDFGAGLESKVGNLFNFSGSIPSVEDYAGLIADNANLSTLPDIADNTGKIKDTLSDTDEDLKYLRDMAEMEVINRYTTAEIKIEQNNHNTVNNGMDLDGVTSALTDGIMEAIDVVTEGVHD